MKPREVELSTTPTPEEIAALRLGDIVYLTGLMYTAREGVYMRALEDKANIPMELPSQSAANFHCSPAASIREDGTFDMDERGDYVSPLRWMKTSLRKDAPHLFVDAEAQAAAAGNTTPSLDGIKNPWLASHWNMSEQGRIYVRDPDLAQRLAADAGSAVGAAKPTR